VVGLEDEDTRIDHELLQDQERAKRHVLIAKELNELSLGYSPAITHEKGASLAES